MPRDAQALGQGLQDLLEETIEFEGPSGCPAALEGRPARQRDGGAGRDPDAAQAHHPALRRGPQHAALLRRVGARLDRRPDRAQGRDPRAQADDHDPGGAAPAGRHRRLARRAQADLQGEGGQEHAAGQHGLRGRPAHVRGPGSCSPSAATWRPCPSRWPRPRRRAARSRTCRRAAGPAAPAGPGAPPRRRPAASRRGRRRAPRLARRARHRPRPRRPRGPARPGGAVHRRRRRGAGGVVPRARARCGRARACRTRPSGGSSACPARSTCVLGAAGVAVFAADRLRRPGRHRPADRQPRADDGLRRLLGRRARRLAVPRGRLAPAVAVARDRPRGGRADPPRRGRGAVRAAGLPRAARPLAGRRGGARLRRSASCAGPRRASPARSRC